MRKKYVAYINTSLDVTSDEISTLLSTIMSKKWREAYLLFSFDARAQSSGYEGFSLFFKHFQKDALVTAELLKNVLSSLNKEMSFAAVAEVANSGSKITDLVEAFLNEKKESIKQFERLKELLVEDFSYRMAIEKAINEIIAKEFDDKHKVEVILKTLERANGDYSAILTIDRKLGENYNGNN